VSERMARPSLHWRQDRREEAGHAAGWRLHLPPSGPRAAQGLCGGGTRPTENTKSLNQPGAPLAEQRATRRFRQQQKTLVLPRQEFHQGLEVRHRFGSATVTHEVDLTALDFNSQQLNIAP